MADQELTLKNQGSCLDKFPSKDASNSHRLVVFFLDMLLCQVSLLLIIIIYIGTTNLDGINTVISCKDCSFTTDQSTAIATEIAIVVVDIVNKII